MDCSLPGSSHGIFQEEYWSGSIYLLIYNYHHQLIYDILQYSWASLVAQLVKDLPAMWETWFRSLGWEDPWRRERLPTSVFLPGESPWTEELDRLQSMGLQRVRYD